MCAVSYQRLPTAAQSSIEMIGWSNGQIEFKLPNGLVGDPSIHAFFVKAGDAILLDLGSLERLEHKDVLKVRKAFVSHTHIDHFIGFDRLLRLNIPHGRTLEICGPTGIAANVAGKLKGYLWNLVDAGQINFLVHELNIQGDVESWEISNDNLFNPTKAKRPQPVTGAQIRPLPEKPGAFICNLPDNSRMEGVCLDHGTPSVAYVCQSNLRFKVHSEELERLNLKPGPWITDIQSKIASGKFSDTMELAGRKWSVGELSAEILTSEAPRVFGYVTDCIFSWENIKRLEATMLDVECLLCESNFCESDHEKAYEKKHLTTKQAALIAAWLNADEIQPFHISKVYRSDPEEIAREVFEYFENYRTLDRKEKELAIERELERKHS